MRHLLLVSAIFLLALGCGDRPPTVKDGDVTVKETNVNVKVPGLPGPGEKKSGEGRATARSVAVLPFKSGPLATKAQGLAETLTASVTKALSRNPELEVRSRAAVEEVRNYKPIPAGTELKVRSVLTGEVKMVNDELVVSLELIDVTKDGTQLWGEVYREKPAAGEGHAKLEEKLLKEVAEAVAEKLGAAKPKKDDEKK